MSRYIEYVEDRLRAELDGEALRREEASAEDYEAALALFGVEAEGDE